MSEGTSRWLSVAGQAGRDGNGLRAGMRWTCDAGLRGVAALLWCSRITVVFDGVVTAGAAQASRYRRGSIYLEDPADVAAYAELFDHLRARALGPDESRALIARLAEDTS